MHVPLARHRFSVQRGVDNSITQINFILFQQEIGERLLLINYEINNLLQIKKINN